MTTRFAVDTSAIVDLMRTERPKPPPLLRDDAEVFLPLPVLGELYVGAMSSLRPELHLADLNRASKTNDYWIAALCLQHDLPLLTNDHGFDHIAGLTVIHW